MYVHIINVYSGSYVYAMNSDDIIAIELCVRVSYKYQIRPCFLFFFMFIPLYKKGIMVEFVKCMNGALRRADSNPSCHVSEILKT